MAFDERGERELGPLAVAAAIADGEPFEELAVREVADGPQMKEGEKLFGRQLLPMRHDSRPRLGWLLGLSEDDRHRTGSGFELRAVS